MVSYISLVYYLYFGFGLLAINNADIHPVVHTDLGAIQGSILESRLSVPFLAFRGIRYAKSPTGTLRFKVIKHSVVPFFFRSLILIVIYVHHKSY